MQWGNTQSLIQLAIALNATYFTFRSANHPQRTEIDTLINELYEYLKRPPITTSSNFMSQISTIMRLYRNLSNVAKHFYVSIDSFMVAIAYAISIVFIFLLLISTLFPDTKISDLACTIIFMFGYLPIFLCLLFEIYIAVVLTYLTSKAIILRDQMNRAIALYEMRNSQRRQL